MSVPAVYVHIPFCEAKCPYCDFNSFAVEGRDVDGYLDALLGEFASRPPPRNPPTIFIGGGTPTVLDAERIDRYLSALTRGMEADPAREFTVEANPGSLTADKVALLAAHGVNRISIGAQSFFDRHLRALGRVHGAADIERAYRLARDGGIAQVNLDFIFAVPGLTRGEWLETLDRAAALRPDHLSCYGLTFEPGTEFHARRAAGAMRAVDEELELAMFRWTERRLRAHGYLRYEISNFSLPGRECKHNLIYWQNGSYIGYGAGAWSYIDGARLGNERHLGRYAEAIRGRGKAFVASERLTGRAAAAEAVVLGLRTARGVDLEEQSARYGVDGEKEFGGIVRALRRAGLVEKSGRIRLARRGWRVADQVATAFL